jgi:hypothetical protein
MSITIDIEGGGYCPIQIRLNTLENSRKTLSRAIRARMNGTLTDTDFRSFTYGMSQLLAYFKTESDQEILRSISEVRTLVEDRSNGKIQA